jgi:hypothetical protein
MLLGTKKIVYYPSDDPRYAKVITPTWENGVKNNHDEHLGVIVDKEKGIFRNRKLGTFKYTLEEGYTSIDIGAASSTEAAPIVKEKKLLDFGDVFALHSVLVENGLWKLICDIMPEYKDTFCALALYRILRGHSNSNAIHWRNASYVQLLCPNARVESQRISEFYERLQKDDVEDTYFKAYLKYIGLETRKEIALDSTHLPNSIKSPFTRISNHNNVITKGSRLIVAVDRKTGLPIFYRLIAGNIVDMTTISTTLSELSGYGVDVSMIIMDAGYFSPENVKALLNERIKFVTRIKPNFVIFKDMVAKSIKTLMCRENRIIYGDRVLYGVRIDLVAFGHDCYGYVFIDMNKRITELNALEKKDASSKKKLADEEYESKRDRCGVFAMISSEKLEVPRVLPTYYTRDVVEKIFSVMKSNIEVLPLNAKTESTYNGQLLVSFVATTWYLSFAEMLKNNSNLGVVEAFDTLFEIKCKVFDDKVTILNPTKQQKEVTDALHVALPTEISLPLDPNKAFKLDETEQKPKYSKKNPVDIHIKEK